MITLREEDSMAESKDEKRVDNNKKNEASLRKQVARMLQVARWSEKMSQEEVASILGTKKSSISRIESGAQNLTVDYLSSYAQALGKEAVLSLREAPVTYAGSSSYSPISLGSPALG